MRTVPKVLLTILLVTLIVGGSIFTIGTFWMASDGIYEVRLIPVRGEISTFGYASSQRIVNQIEDADADPMVKAIIIEVNSPGGTVVASEEIATAIERTDKPVVTWMREVAASGGYWIASSTDKIVADPATITGSLGVSASYLQYAKYMEAEGITYERLVSGEHKDVGSPYKELSASGRSSMQGKINKIRDMFIDHVASTRNMTWTEVSELATGEIFLGVEAKENGLVDELGGKEEALAIAKELAGIENAAITEPSDFGTFLELFLTGKFLLNQDGTELANPEKEPLILSIFN